jgi:thymidine phosphorylase
VYGRELQRDDYHAIVRDTLDGTLADLDIAAFLTACASRELPTREITALTLAMVDAGQRLTWPQPVVLDKHCVGGLAGNRTTPIVVAIVAACGGTIPKTSSRAITSPAGTADTMETLAPVSLSLDHMRRVVEREGGCIVWGGSVGLSPADDALIRIEKALDFDSDPQLVASVLSKKLAAGSTHLLLDMPVGPTAKVRSAQAAEALASRLRDVAAGLGLATSILMTDGSQPVGGGIGPALEARGVLAVLERRADAAADLRERSLQLAGALLELGGLAAGDGYEMARRTLDEGRALRKFEAICQAQGGRRVPPEAAHRHAIEAFNDGTVTAIDNRLLSRTAKLAGAPRAAAAGLELHVRQGDVVSHGQPLYTVHAATRGELEYALAYCRHHPNAVEVGRA